MNLISVSFFACSIFRADDSFDDIPEVNEYLKEISAEEKNLKIDL